MAGRGSETGSGLESGRGVEAGGSTGREVARPWRGGRRRDGTSGTEIGGGTGSGTDAEERIGTGQWRPADQTSTSSRLG